MAENDGMLVPEPEGPPVMSEGAQKLVRRLGTMGLTVVIGGTAAFLLLAIVPTRTHGALRSQRVKWQERQAEIAAEVAEQQGPAAEVVPAAEGPEEVARE
jgi:hypothetical protein